MAPEAPQLLLPFAEREYISLKRTMQILGVSHTTIFNLRRARRIGVVDFGGHTYKRVHYQSVVDFCDRLRQRYGIPDRRPPLQHSIFRHRDEDLLPFPLSDTISTREAASALGYETEKPIHNFIECGKIEAYKISKMSPWRVSRQSLSALLAAAYERAEVRYHSVEDGKLKAVASS